MTATPVSAGRLRGLLGESAGVSVLLHGLLVAVLLWQPWRRAAPPPPPPMQATLQVERVNQQAAQRGGRPAAAVKAPPARAPSRPSPPMAAAQSVKLPAAAGPMSPSAPPQPPAPPAPAAPATQPAPPEPAVNLGNGDQDHDAFSDSGDIVSTGPDLRYHNMPPRYPADAARHRQGGIVTLLVHVNADGTAGLIEVINSSGVESLDEAAQEAVARWHFVAPEQNGVRVASLYPINIRFNAEAQ